MDRWGTSGHRAPARVPDPVRLLPGPPLDPAPANRTHPSISRGTWGTTTNRERPDQARPSAAPGAARPARGSLPLGSGGGHQGSSETGACLRWPSGTRSWATPARWRPPRRPADSGEARVRPCRWVGLPRRIPFVRRTRCSVGPEMARAFVRHDNRGVVSDDAGTHPPSTGRTGRSCRPG
jgi:hypothetical protein